MTKEILFHDYQLICQMKVGMNRKVRLLAELFTEGENPWRVVGITTEAVKCFQANGFKKVAKMGINRSHLVNRATTYKHLLSNEFNDLEIWWEYYFQSDKTILATSSENITGNYSEIIDIDASLGLFKHKGFGWIHQKNEVEFLRILYSKYFPNS